MLVGDGDNGEEEDEEVEDMAEDTRYRLIRIPPATGEPDGEEDDGRGGK